MSQSWKEYSKLARKKYRQVSGRYLVEGIRLCRDALNSDRAVEIAFISEPFSGHPDYPELEKRLLDRNIPVRFLAEANFRRLADTENPQGIVLIMPIPDPLPVTALRPAESPVILILDGIKDPGNLGTLLRTADWFGVQSVIASGDSADFYNPKVVRASMGSIFHLNLNEVRNLPHTISGLKKAGYTIVGTAGGGAAQLEDFTPPEAVALVLGNEAEGMSPVLQRLSDAVVAIKKYGAAESLNVSIAGAIVLNHLAARLMK